MDNFALHQIFPGHSTTNLWLRRKQITDRLWEIGIEIKTARQKSKQLREVMLRELAARKQKRYDLGNPQVTGNIKAMKNAEVMQRKYAALRATKHLRDETGNVIQVLKGHHSVDEMWESLKIKRVAPKDPNSENN